VQGHNPLDDERQEKKPGREANLLAAHLESLDKRSEKEKRAVHRKARVDVPEAGHDWVRLRPSHTL